MITILFVCCRRHFSSFRFCKITNNWKTNLKHYKLWSGCKEWSESVSYFQSSLLKYIVSPILGRLHCLNIPYGGFSVNPQIQFTTLDWVINHVPRLPYHHGSLDTQLHLPLQSHSRCGTFSLAVYCLSENNFPVVSNSPAGYSKHWMVSAFQLGNKNSYHSTMHCNYCVATVLSVVHLFVYFSMLMAYILSFIYTMHNNTNFRKRESGTLLLRANFYTKHRTNDNHIAARE